MDCRWFFLRPAAFLPKAASPASFLLLKSAMAAMHHLRGFPACSLTDPVYGDTESAGPSVRRAGISWQGGSPPAGGMAAGVSLPGISSCRGRNEAPDVSPGSALTPGSSACGDREDPCDNAEREAPEGFPGIRTAA